MTNTNFAVDVNNITIRFNLSNQRIDNLKEYFIKLAKKELMFQEFLALKRRFPANTALEKHGGSSERMDQENPPF